LGAAFEVTPSQARNAPDFLVPILGRPGYDRSRADCPPSRSPASRIDLILRCLALGRGDRRRGAALLVSGATVRCARPLRRRLHRQPRRAAPRRAAPHFFLQLPLLHEAALARARWLGVARAVAALLPLL